MLGTLVAGIAVWGGVGALLDHLLGTTFLVVVGLMLGFTAAMYLVYIRYARQ
ncbi:MAG: AtpZ/AtpI family protein [Actinomycetota bacterium]|nr:AtpZ/AtpI family protein [Actinomycetota bacterium]